MASFVVHTARSSPGAPPVVLMHGVFTDHHLWDPVVDLLHGLDVTALDSPGHGDAARLGPLPALEVQVEQLKALLRDRFSTPILLAGHSWGGMLGLRLAVAHPELVSGLLLANTPLSRNRGSARIGFLAQRALIAAGLPASTYGRLAARSLYGAAYRRDHPDIGVVTARTTAALGRVGVDEVITRILLEPEDVHPLLQRLEIPVTLVAGVADYVGSAAEQDRVAAVGYRLEHHPGGHMGPREAPEQLARALRELSAHLECHSRSA